MPGRCSNCILIKVLKLLKEKKSMSFIEHALAGFLQIKHVF